MCTFCMLMEWGIIALLASLKSTDLNEELNVRVRDVEVIYYRQCLFYFPCQMVKQ